VEWTLFRGEGERRSAIDTHPLLDLLDHPNPFLTGYDLFDLSQIYMELTGESWWVFVSTGRNLPMEIWPVSPERMKPVPHPTKYLSGYLYQPPGQSEPIPLELDDVLYVCNPNPSNPYRGISPLQSLMLDVQGETAAAEWNRMFFQNSAEPGGIIQVNETMSDPEWERFVTRWNQQHRGTSRSHRVAVLERGEWVDRKVTQREMEFQGGRKMARDNILGGYGIHRHIIGITEDVNLANAREADSVFARYRVLPRLRRWRAKLNEALVPRYGSGMTLDFNDPVPADRELDLKVAVESFSGQLLTRNEARALLGYDSVSDGDDFLAVPLALPSDTESTEERQVKSEGVGLDEDQRTAEDKMADAWEDRLASEREKIAAHVVAQSKAVKRIEVSDLDSYEWRWMELFGDAVGPELVGVFVEMSRELPEPVASTYAREYAGARAADLIQGLEDTTRKRVRLLVENNIANGEGIDTLARQIRDDNVFSRSRAETIARTETAFARGAGSKAVAITQGRDEKRWRTARDERVDGGNASGPCIEAEGAGWIPIADSFPNGRDAAPAHPRCRCDTEGATSPPPPSTAAPAG
jgi:HK97 family phage portal protein